MFDVIEDKLYVYLLDYYEKLKKKVFEFFLEEVEESYLLLGY